jgi:hypothetical protein
MARVQEFHPSEVGTRLAEISAAFRTNGAIILRGLHSADEVGPGSWALACRTVVLNHPPIRACSLYLYLESYPGQLLV